MKVFNCFIVVLLYLICFGCKVSVNNFKFPKYVHQLWKDRRVGGLVLEANGSFKTISSSFYATGTYTIKNDTLILTSYYSRDSLKISRLAFTNTAGIHQDSILVYVSMRGGQRPLYYCLEQICYDGNVGPSLYTGYSNIEEPYFIINRMDVEKIRFIYSDAISEQILLPDKIVNTMSIVIDYIDRPNPYYFLNNVRFLLTGELIEEIE